MGEGKPKTPQGRILRAVREPVLKISFIGEVPGLPEERLSVAAFARPLALLLQAYRRIASGLIRDALRKRNYGRRGGKYAERAATIDLELSSLTHESPLTLEFQCTAKEVRANQMELFDDILDRAGVVLLDAIKAESAGHLHQYAVRYY